jgi:hypothetical protein
MQRPSRVYQILVMLIYGDYPWLERMGDGLIECKIRGLAKGTSCDNKAVRLALRWLKEKHFFVELELYMGYVRLRLAPPKKLFLDFGYEEEMFKSINNGSGI